MDQVVAWAVLLGVGALVLDVAHLYAHGEREAPVGRRSEER